MDDQRYPTETTTDVRDYKQPQTCYQMEIFKPELDLNYVKTLSGTMKCVCITLDFICFVCLLVGGPAYYTAVGRIIFVCGFGMLVSLILLILYLFHIVDLLRQIPWIVAEMIFNFVWAVFFFICGCVLILVAARFHGITGYGAASNFRFPVGTVTTNFQFFSFGAMCAYGFDSYVKFLAWRHNEVATGGTALKYLPYGNTTIPKNRETEIVISE